MIKNYLKLAYRNLMKHKVFSFINIFGLAIGLTCCMLISLYIYNELSYDSYHKNIKQLYQLGTTFIKDGNEDRTANTPALMAKTMQMEFPEIEKSTRLVKAFLDDKTLFQYTGPNGDMKSFYESRGYLADSNFFQLLTYNFVDGDPLTALVNPLSIVLNEDIAKKIFGKESAINKVIHISSTTNGDHDYKVTGVFAPAKSPSHIDARFFMSMKGGNMAEFADITDLATNNMFFTYLILKPGCDPKTLERKFPEFIEKYAGKNLKAMGFYKKQFLTAVKDIHLDAKLSNNVTPGGSATYLYILGSIALFTLLIACINFMNLSTARSSKRSAEVGVRKILGAMKSGLIRQFLGESIIMSLIAFVIALILTELLLPLFSIFAGRELYFSFSQHALLLISFFVLSIITGLISGIYPAFYLSSFKPVKVLKGRFTNSLAAVSLRKSLVVFQFVISVVLIVASVVIFNQMHYLRTTDLGFAKDQQIIIPMRSENAKKIYPALKNKIQSNSDIDHVGATLYYPGLVNPSDMGLYTEGRSMNEAKNVHMNWVDNSFLQTLEIKPLAGRLFSPEFPGDTLERIILNASAVKELGFASADKAVGSYVYFDWQGKSYKYEIVGVVKDFHFQDLHVPILPYGFELNNRKSYNYIVAHARLKDIPGILKTLEADWNNLNPNEPFEYSFLDEEFQKNYVAEERLTAIVGYFTVIAILISCLGLFGLGTFSAEQRTKEIGIRKVLGASVSGIVALLSKDFLKLVLIAIVIASPIAWWAMNKWLQDFAYRVSISWWVFVIAGIAAILIALFTISFQAIKAAITNPVKNLRTE